MLLTACLALGLLLHAQERPVREPPSADPYDTLVSEYREKGRPAIVDLESWTEAQVRAAVERATRDRDHGWTWQELRTAAALHTDLWYICPSATCRTDPAAHLAAAERLLDAIVRAESPQTQYAQRWYATIGGLLKYWKRDALADELAQHSRRV